MGQGLGAAVGGANQQIGNNINQATNGIVGMANAGIDGSAQGIINAGTQAAGQIAGNYNAGTGATIANSG